jgi:hypothetical protein
MVVRANAATSGAEAGNIWGLNGLNATAIIGQAQIYTGPFNKGCYAGAYNTSSVWTFQPIIENQGYLPNSIISGVDWGQLSPGTGPFTGLDNNFDSLVIKFGGMGLGTMSGLIKTWTCVEYKVVSGQLLYEYQTLSPCDALALDYYRKIILELPIAVPFTDNESFWKRILSIMRSLSGTVAASGSPYAPVAMGINALTSGIESLYV